QVAAWLLEVRARMSAVPADAGPAVMSTMRKRRRVIAPPVLLTKRRRIENVPRAELLAGFGSGVESRKRGQGCVAAVALPVQPGSIKVALIVALRWMGLAKLSGPGAPSVACVPLNMPPVVEQKTNSAPVSAVFC